MGKKCKPCGSLPGYRKILMVMRLSFFLFLMSTTLVFGSAGYSQGSRISLSVKNVPLKEIFKAIEEQTDYVFFYQDQQIDLNRRASVEATDRSVDDILRGLFAGTNNVFVIRDRQIVIGQSPRKAERMDAELHPVLVQQDPDFVVTGKISDAVTSESIPGVNIVVEGTKTGISSDKDGNFSLEIPDPNSVLLVSCVGYIPQRIPVQGRKIVNIAMTPDVMQLQEVVTIGYGIQKKVNLSGSVDVVSSKEITNRPVNNVVQALQGLAPNLNVIVGNEGGEVGGKMSMNIRGIGSISGSGGNPYVLVDGIEQSIYNINPDDVENISVLKDAAASAIYGARAAFGVILVTTKKGRNDGMLINYSDNFSWAAPLHLPKMVNSLDFAQTMNLAAANDGAAAVFQPIIIENIKKYQAGELTDWTIPVPWAPNYWLTYAGGWANTDWFKVDYKDWVPKSVHNLSLSGGDKKTQFYISGSNFNQEGLLRYGNDNFTRNNLNARINTNIYSWLRLNFLTKMNLTRLDRPSYNKDRYYQNIARRWPTNGVYFPDGNLNYEGEQNWLLNGGRYKENGNELTVIPGLEIEPVKDWVIYANYRWKYNNEGYTNHEAKVKGTFVDGTSMYLRPNNFFAVNQNLSYYSSPNVYTNYTRKFGKHDFTVMAGFEQEEVNYSSAFSRKDDLISDDLPSLGTATGKEYSSGTLGHWATRSFFGRFNYNYEGKYLLEVSGRRDGSSKFEQGYRWGTFPSASVAYVISKESFWDKLASGISLLKARVSYGSLGNQDVANYLYVERLPIYTNLPYLLGTMRPNYVGMAGLISPGLTWEKVRTTNFGVDAGFFGNRLTGSFDYFIRNTFDMLGPAESYPAVLGTPVPQSNNSTLRTTGFEAQVTWRHTIGDFHYDASFMLSDATTKIISYRNPQNLLSAPYYEGKTLGEIWGYTTVGFFASDEEAKTWDQSYISREKWTAGDIRYADLNGDNKIDRGKNTLDDHGDLSIIGNFMPRYNYSFLFNAGWKGFDFSMIWQGVGKRDLWLDSPHFWGVGWIWTSVVFEDHMDYWTAENTDAYYPKPRMDKAYMNRQVQTRYLQNGAYLRLKSLQLAYTLPAVVSSRIFIKNIRIFVVGENLLTFTKLMKEFDPETTGGLYGAGFIYPIQKNISFGVNVTF